MIATDRNIFVVGPKATGDSFFGRKRQINDLRSIFGGVDALHLIAPTKAGKSSLAKMVLKKNESISNHIRVELSMGSYRNATHFWSTMYKKIRRSIMEAKLLDASFSDCFEEINGADQQSPYWFETITEPLLAILEHLGECNYRLVLIIDEFDDVARVFEGQSYYFQTLREIFYEPGYHTSGVIISRRTLKVLEAKCPDISTFHGVFRRVPLQAFDDADMCEYYAALERYSISLTEDAKARLVYYTGRMPYLCCMLAQRMVSHRSEFLEFDAAAIDTVFQACLPQIDEYYDDLIRYMEADNQLELLYYLSIDSALPKELVDRERKNMEVMGVLSYDETAHGREYYAFSRDFMTYFRLKPLDLPEWEMMTACEKKIKQIFGAVYPELAATTYQDLLDEGVDTIKARINGKYPGIDLKWNQIMVYCKDLSAHKKHPTVLDVLTLAQVIDRILKKMGRKILCPLCERYGMEA